MALKLRKLSYALGAEVCDVDVARPMSEVAFGEIYHAFLQNGILLFRNQDITREQHIEFSRRFGELDRHEALPRDRHPRLSRAADGHQRAQARRHALPTPSTPAGSGTPTCRSPRRRRSARC